MSKLDPKRHAALILAIGGKPKDSEGDEPEDKEMPDMPDDSDEEDEEDPGKKARLMASKDIMKAIKAGKDEELESALHDFYKACEE